MMKKDISVGSKHEQVANRVIPGGKSRHSAWQISSFRVANFVIPAKAGIQYLFFKSMICEINNWFPAFAGMTVCLTLRPHVSNSFLFSAHYQCECIALNNRYPINRNFVKRIRSY
jgi:hypothetical protein